MNVIIGYKHIQGIWQKVYLPWDNNIGALIVGRPGSGKSHAIASLLTQYALKGAEIAIAEFSGDIDNPQSLLYRTKHIHKLLCYDLVTTGDEMVQLITWLYDKLKRRQAGKEERTECVVVLDEFFQFAATVKPKETSILWKEGDAWTEQGETRSFQKAANYWGILMGILSDLRKNNIRVFIATQEPSSTATSDYMRQARDMFRLKLIMNLSSAGANLLGVTSRPSQVRISTLKPGFIYADGHIIVVPYPLAPELIQACENKTPRVKEIKQYIWTQEDTDLYLEALFKYWTKFDTIRINDIEIASSIDDKNAVIRFFVLIGKNNEFIKQHVKGNTNEVVRIANTYRAEYRK